MTQVIHSLISKLESVERELAEEWGGFSLFALLLREEALDQWDLVVAAPWLKGKRKEGITRIAGLLQSGLDQEELLSLSRIVVLDDDSPVRNAIRSTVHVEHGLAEVSNVEFEGIEVKRGLFLVST